MYYKPLNDIAEYSGNKVSQKLGRRHKLHFNQDFICNIEAVFQQSLLSVYATLVVSSTGSVHFYVLKKKKENFHDCVILHTQHTLLEWSPWFTLKCRTPFLFFTDE